MRCENCGADLSGSDYALPWEDDDNEYGFWTCDNCGETTTDWSSGDDD